MDIPGGLREDFSNRTGSLFLFHVFLDLLLFPIFSKHLLISIDVISLPYHGDSPEDGYPVKPQTIRAYYQIYGDENDINDDEKAKVLIKTSEFWVVPRLKAGITFCLFSNTILIKCTI